MCGCDYICVSSFTRLKKINSRVLWRIKGSLCVMRAYFLREPLRPCLLVCGHLPALVRALRRLLTFSIRACVFVCLCARGKRVSLSCVPVILCMLRPAPQCFTWHQSEHSGIVISLPTACCWLKPVVCNPPSHFPPYPFLFFFPPPSPLSSASLSFASPPPASSTPQLQSRTILWFLHCLLPKRAPFPALQKVISSPHFSFSVLAISLFSLLCFTSLGLLYHRLNFPKTFTCRPQRKPFSHF